MPNRTTKIVLVDDQREIVELVKLMIENQDRTVYGFTDPVEALKFITAKLDVDLLISDMNMPVMDGLELIEKARLVSPNLSAILLTGRAAKDMAIKALNIGCQYLVEKPIVNKELIYCVEMVSNTGRWGRIAGSLIKECKDLISLLQDLSAVHEERIRKVESLLNRTQIASHINPNELQSYLGSISKSIRTESKVISATEVVEKMSLELEKLQKTRVI